MRKFLMYLCAMVFFTVATMVLSSAVYADTIRVGLLRSNHNQSSISVPTTSIEVGRGHADGTFNHIQTLNSAAGFTITASGEQVLVRAGGAGGAVQFTFITGVAGSPQIRAANGGTVGVGSNVYRGFIEFRPSGGNVSAINVLPMEQYLYGVLPLEMSPSFNIEALRAQAVAARTFASYTRSYGRHTTWLDVCDSPSCCQSYLGAGREDAITTQAVRDTAGLKMFNPGSSSPLFTPYFSSSGGATLNNENVWWATLSHLRGVPDFYEQDAREWTRTFTWAQLTSAVAAQAPNANIGTVTSVTTTHSPFGPVHSMTFTGTNGEWTARGENVRLMFRHAGGSLNSQNFQLEGGTATDSAVATATNVTVTSGTASRQAQVTDLYVVNNQNQVTRVSNAHISNGLAAGQAAGSAFAENVTVTGGAGITMNGRGWGHLVGMSQNGANGMAQAGHDFHSILTHYYTGVEIR